MTAHFPRGSVIRRVNIEPAIALGAGRALVLQLARPEVAQGVADHSDFKRNPFSRLLGTLEATYAVVFGSADLAEGVGRRLRWIHSHVVGAGYSANDPTHLLWVHATLVDTALRCYEDLVATLPVADAETYYQEMRRVAEVFGVPAALQPKSLTAFRAWFDHELRRLEVTDTGRDLIGFVLDPELPLRLHRPLGPLLRAQRTFTLGSLPDPVRDQLEAPWGTAESAAFERLRRRARQTFQWLPAPVRTAPNVAVGPLLMHQAARHVRAFDRRTLPVEGASAA